MRTTASMMEIACPRCGEDFAAWDRPSVDPLRESTCPHCGHSIASDPRIREDGGWLAPDEELRDQ